jgi:hypothetical protein
MRIAICFSGQIRTGVESSLNLLNFFGDNFSDCDFFIHTWDINTTKFYNGILPNPEIEKITDENIEKIIGIYNPKNVKVESFNEFNDEFPKRYYIAEHWYSFMKSVEMKREFEVENNFTYDYVVKLRLDIIFHPDRRLIDDIKLLGENEFYIENFSNELIDGRLWSDDVYFISNSTNMDNASKYFEVAYETYNNDSSDLYIFTDQLLKHNVELVGLYKWRDYHKDSYRYTIYRKECFKFSQISEFNDCFYCDHHFFDSNVNKDENKTYYVNTLKGYKEK